MHLHLFSSPGERDIRYIVDASRPYLVNHPHPTVAFLPAAAVEHNWLDYTEKAFQDLATIDLIDVENMTRSEIETILNRTAVIYISGGNTFLLNHRLHQSGIFPMLRQKIVDGLPVVAFSAGATLCGPNILTSNDMNMCETTFFAALNLLPYNFSVHYPADGNPADGNPADEPARVEWDEWLQEYHAFHTNPILAMEDGAYLRVRSGEVVVVRGNCWLLAKGEVRWKVENGKPLMG